MPQPFSNRHPTRHLPFSILGVGCLGPWHHTRRLQPTQPSLVPPHRDHHSSPPTLRNTVVGHIHHSREELVFTQTFAQVINDPPPPPAIAHFQRQHLPYILRHNNSRPQPLCCGKDFQHQLVELFLAAVLARAPSAATRIRRTHALTRRRSNQKVEIPISRIAICFFNPLVRPTHIAPQPSRVPKVPFPDSDPMAIPFHLNQQPEPCQRVPQVTETGPRKKRHRSERTINRWRCLLPHERRKFPQTQTNLPSPLPLQSESPQLTLQSPPIVPAPSARALEHGPHATHPPLVPG